MPEKPSKTPQEWAEERRRTFKLYVDRHWVFGDRVRVPNGKPRIARLLVPQLQEWLDGQNFPYRLTLAKYGRSKIIFEHADHAMLFKLAWR